jgi:hypothetical protein
VLRPVTGRRVALEFSGSTRRAHDSSSSFLYALPPFMMSFRLPLSWSTASVSVPPGLRKRTVAYK